MDSERERSIFCQNMLWNSKLKVYSVDISVGQESGGTQMNVTSMTMDFIEEEKVTHTTTFPHDPSNVPCILLPTPTPPCSHLPTPTHPYQNPLWPAPMPQIGSTAKFKTWEIGSSDGKQRTMGFLITKPEISLIRLKELIIPDRLSDLALHMLKPNPLSPNLARHERSRERLERRQKERKQCRWKRKWQRGRREEWKPWQWLLMAAEAGNQVVIDAHTAEMRTWTLAVAKKNSTSRTLSKSQPEERGDRHVPGGK